jgi:alcohol dehydrogenase class IV
VGGFIAVGGGSAIDTAKAINLLTSHPGELMDYINKPIGRQRSWGRAEAADRDPDDGGTGSESTAMCILDIPSMKVKTGSATGACAPPLAFP